MIRLMGQNVQNVLLEDYPMSSIKQTLIKKTLPEIGDNGQLFKYNASAKILKDLQFKL